jgi:hypothetical protein
MQRLCTLYLIVWMLFEKSMDNAIHFNVLFKVQPEILVICLPYVFFLIFWNKNSLLF